MPELDNTYIGLGISNPPPVNTEKSISNDFPEELGEMLAKLTKDEVLKLIEYVRTKS